MTDASSEVISRRQLFRGDLRGNKAPKRPPWAVPEATFIQTCTRCDACINACEEGVLRQGSGGFPEVNFKHAGCTFCGDCLAACEPKALNSDYPAPSLAWNLKAFIHSNCLSIQGIVCRACGDACDTDAIRFQLKTAGKAFPDLDLERCNGCGECFAVCPNQAVEINEHKFSAEKPSTTT